MAEPCDEGNCAFEDSGPVATTPPQDECGNVIFVAGAGRSSRRASRLGPDNAELIAVHPGGGARL